MQRRYFLAGAAVLATSRRRAVAANDKITIAMMGINGRAQTLAQWFGAADGDLNGVFPTLANFPVRNIGFV